MVFKEYEKNRSYNFISWILSISIFMLIFNFIINYNLTNVFLFTSFLFITGIIISSFLGLEETKIFVTIFIINLIINIALYFFYKYKFGIPYPLNGSDALPYERNAYLIASRLKWYEYFSIRGNLLSETHNSIGYAYIISIIIRIGKFIGGFHTFMPRVFNIFLLSFISIFGYKISIDNLLLNKYLSKKIAIIIGFSPIMIYVSSSSFRDILVSFLLIYIYYVWNQFYKKNNINKFIIIFITIFTLFLLWETRRFASILAMVVIIFNLLYPSNLKLKIKYKFIIITFISFLFIYFYVDGQLIWFIDRLQRYISVYSKYRSSTSGIINIITKQILPIRIVMRLIYFYSFPPVTLNASFENFMLGLGTILRFLYLPYLIVGIKKIINSKQNLGIIVGYTMIFTAVAISSNTFRHIVMYYPFEVLIAIYGFSKIRVKKIELFLFSFFIILSQLIFYTLYQL